VEIAAVLSARAMEAGHFINKSRSRNKVFFIQRAPAGFGPNKRSVCFESYAEACASACHKEANAHAVIECLTQPALCHNFSTSSPRALQKIQTLFTALPPARCLLCW
jgi:hypothetical protein